MPLKVLPAKPDKKTKFKSEKWGIKFGFLEPGWVKIECKDCGKISHYTDPEEFLSCCEVYPSKDIAETVGQETEKMFQSCKLWLKFVEAVLLEKDNP